MVCHWSVSRVIASTHAARPTSAPLLALPRARRTRPSPVLMWGCGRVRADSAAAAARGGQCARWAAVVSGCVAAAQHCFQHATTITATYHCHATPTTPIVALAPRVGWRVSDRVQRHPIQDTQPQVRDVRAQTWLIYDWLVLGWLIYDWLIFTTQLLTPSCYGCPPCPPLPHH